MSTINTNSAASNKQHWYKSPLLLIWLFMVLMAMAGTIYMVIQANSGFPGLVVEDFYERGQDYEENIQKKLKNNEKWDTEFKISAIHQNKPATINFTIKDKAGVLTPVEKITLYAYRLSDAKQDFSAAMTMTENKTGYQVSMIFKSKGKWDLLASAVIDGIEVNYAKRIFVKD